MVRTFNLEAAVTPSVDEREAEREAESVRSKIQEAVSGIQPEFEEPSGGIAGAGGAGSGLSGGTSRRRGGVPGGAGALAGVGGAISKVVSGGLMKVALGGAVGFGLLKGIQKLSGASPALQAEFTKIRKSVELFARPFGRLIARRLRPLSDALLQTSVRFLSLAEEEGLAVAVGTIATDAAKDFAGYVADEIKGAFGFGEDGFSLEKLLEGGPLGPTKISSKIAEELAAAWPGWDSIVGSVSLPNFVTSVSLPEFVTSVSLPEFVTDVDLSTFVDPFPGWPEIPTPEFDVETTIGVNITGSVQEFFEGRVDIDSVVDSVVDRASGQLPGGGGFGGGGGGGSDDDDGGGSDPAFGSPGRSDDRADRIDDSGPAIGLASGGIVTRETTAVIGEGSEDEAVMPLSRLEQFIDRPEGGGQRVDITIEEINAGADVDGRQLTREMKRELKRFGI